jgi:chaperonin cofactor prefoldin
MTEEIEEQLETIDYAIYNMQRNLEKLRDKFDALKALVEVTVK